MTQKNKVRYDGEAFVEANTELVRETMAHLRRMDALDARIRQDTNLSAFLARQLVFVRGEIEHTIYEDVRAAEFVPVEGGHPRGALTYATQLMETTGKAKISADLAGEDPRVDAQVDEDFEKYVNVRASYAYTVQDLESAALAGVPLPSWKSEACADVIARGIDTVGQYGDATAGLTGFLNNANVTLHTLTNGEWNGAIDDTLRAAILADLAELETTLITNTKDTAMRFGGYSLVLPPTYEGILTTNFVTAATAQISLKNWFLANNRGLITSIERYQPLESLTTPNVAASDAPMAVVYPRNKKVIVWPHAISYEEQAPQIQGWEYVIRARARVGGVTVRRPTHMLYVQNLD